MEQFLKRFNISKEKFIETGLIWEDLLAIKNDFNIFKSELDAPANFLVQKFLGASKVHSVRYRIKDPDHLIDKIIRKKLETPDRVINIENYKTEITDLIGLRILHLFKEDWQIIHNFIVKNWSLHERPTAYYRTGDTQNYIDNFKSHACEVKEHPFGYRSVHYLIETTPSKTTYVAETQVRTIFEEAWSEIDHKIRYPNDLENELLSQFLVVFNRLAGSADEMGSYVQYLKKELTLREEKQLEILEKKTRIIEELKAKIKVLKLEPNTVKVFESEMNSLLDFYKFDSILPKLEYPDLTLKYPAIPKLEYPDLTFKYPTIPKIEYPDLTFKYPAFPRIEIPDLPPAIQNKINDSDIQKTTVKKKKDSQKGTESTNSD